MKDQNYELPPLKAGALPTMNQDDYPGLGDWWVQLRTGPDNDEVFARVYGDSPEQAVQRAEAIVATQADRQRRCEPVELQGVAEAISNGDGFWRSCSGCHETNEGYDTGPYSKTLRCHLGNGCSECGGIGAVWDDTDYDAMADYMARGMGSPQPAEQGRGEPKIAGFDRLRRAAAKQEAKDGIGAMDALYDLAVKHGASRTAAAGFAHVANGAFATLEGLVHDEIRLRILTAQTTQPAEPSIKKQINDEWAQKLSTASEPVKVPSDAQPLLDMIDTLCNGLEWNIENYPAIMNEADSEALAEARALLARYGQKDTT